MIFSSILLIAGLMLLVFAGDLLVRGAVGVAEILGIEPLIIGLTVVAFGTSAPELFVSVQAVLQGSPGLAIGNIVGSNIANVLAVLGLPAVILAFQARQPGIRRNLSVMLAFSAVLTLMILDGTLSRLEGAILFTGLCAYVWWQIHRAHKSRTAVQEDYREEIGEAPHDMPRVVFYILIGLAGLPIAAQLTVVGASDIARSFGVSETAIGLTIVALGTSLPELATSFMAALRKSNAVAIGNIVGSNIFNIACIMGITALILPLPVPESIIGFDIWIMMATALILATIGYARIRVGRAGGVAMLTAYAAYVYLVF